MVEFLSDYGLFLLKAVTVVAAFAVIVGTVVAAGARGVREERGHIEVLHLNERFDQLAAALKDVVLDAAAIKQDLKQQKKAEKDAHKASRKAQKKRRGGADAEHRAADRRRRLYVIDFDGDIKASAVRQLREEISAVLTLATAMDEVVVKLESGGGMVHSYGLAASQLQRIRNRGVPLTVCVDKVAASGGYMMACIANKIIAAPFAMLGSIGVVAQLPNFNRLLKKHDVDFEMLTAGEYKRTLTLFGENTDKGREKFVEELEQTHELFKVFVQEHRPQVDIDRIATGEVWFGTQAIGKKLVDEINTSDQYLMDQRDSADLYEVRYVAKRSVQERLGLAAEGALSRTVERALAGLQQSRFFT